MEKNRVNFVRLEKAELLKAEAKDLERTAKKKCELIVKVRLKIAAKGFNVW
jgi:hypothetical protein